MPFKKDSLEVELYFSKKIESRAEVVHARTDLSKLLQQFRGLMGLRWGPHSPEKCFQHFRCPLAMFRP